MTKTKRKLKTKSKPATNTPVKTASTQKTAKKDVVHHPEAIRVLLGLTFDAVKISKKIGRLGFGLLEKLRFSNIRLRNGIKLPNISNGIKVTRNIVVKMPPLHLTPTEAKDDSVILEKLGEAISSVQTDDENLLILDLDNYFRELNKK